MVNFKKIRAGFCCFCILLAMAVSATGCSGGSSSDDSDTDTSIGSTDGTSGEDASGDDTASEGSSGDYTFEFEDVDFAGKIGTGLSGSCEGTGMIAIFYPDFYSIPEENQASNNHYVTYTYAGGIYFDFNFTSDSDAAAKLVLRASTEVGNMTYGPNSLEISVNGTVLDYPSFTIEQGYVDNAQVPYYFYDFTITSGASLVAGDNTITVKVLENTMRNGATAAACFDCIKISTDAKLEFTPIAGNY